MALRLLKAGLFAVILIVLCGVAQAQTGDANSASGSVFSDTGQGGKWIEQFFPYNNPNIGGIQAAIGKMLAVYNTGILVLAGMLTLWAILTFILDSAHHGTLGGGRHSVLYGPLRLVVALGLLVPLGTGYNGAQIIALQLAESGSGLANAVWKKFSPTTASYDFSRSSFASSNIDGFLQQALIDESCLAATQLNTDKGDPPGVVAIQAIYPNSEHPDRATEGAEFPLLMGDNSITTESHIIGQTAQEIRIHYNRVGNDDYCGSLSLPVPVVPEKTTLDAEDQTAYAAAYLAIRPALSAYAQKLAFAIDAAVKAQEQSHEPQSADAPESQAYVPPGSAAAAPAAPPPPPTASPKIEVPQIELPVSAWDALIDHFNSILLSATDNLQTKYIDGEIQKGNTEDADQDWFWAGSIFFKLTRLSHDDLKLRFGSVSANLPNPQILPAEMRSDGVLASCPDLRSDVFLPDYHCRPEGKENTLIVKTAYQVLHTLQSQRVGDSLLPIDAGPSAERKGDLLAGNLIQTARLDTVISALAQSVKGKETRPGEHFNSMFEAVNIGNALYLASSSLFHASSLAGAINGNGVSSLVLSLFACLILVPGFFLAVYLPLLPALRFFLGIATWLVTIFEALVAMPLIALVQLRTQGEGILPHGRQGWFLLLQMLLRPALMVFGLMAGIIIFDALYGFITWGIWSALLNISGDASQFGNGIEGLLELLGYLMFWSVLVYFAANLSFNAITAIPDRILLWVGAADFGAVVQAPSISSGGSQPMAIAAGNVAAPSVAISAGAAPTMISSSTVVSGGGGGTREHFPQIAEVHIPEGPGNFPTVTGGEGPRILPGAPAAPPIVQNNFIAPTQGGSKRDDPKLPRDQTDNMPPVQGGDK